MSLYIPKIKRPLMHGKHNAFRQARWIAQFFPPHITYVEPFGGTGDMIAQKPFSAVEVFNDINEEVESFFLAIQNHELRANMLSYANIMTLNHSMPDWLPMQINQYGQRFTHVKIENTEAINCMLHHNDDTTLFFVDPPAIGKGDCIYDYHAMLLGELRRLKGMVVVHARPSTLYNVMLHDWHAVQRYSCNNKRRRINPHLWINPRCFETLRELGIIGGVR